jgi:ElaB/YqjD/DUF883 family membrane-anchored ribosome-binding protein
MIAKSDVALETPPATPKLLRTLKTQLTRFRDRMRVLEKTEHTIETVEEIDSEVHALSDLAQDAEEISSSSSTVLDAASKIPLAVTEELKPVAVGVSAIDHGLKKIVVPAMTNVAKALGTVTVLLVGVLSLVQAFMKRNEGLQTAVDHAESVTDQMLEKFGDQVPDAMHEAMAKIASALEQLEPRVEPLDAALARAEKALDAITPILSLADVVRPFAVGMRELHDMLHPVMHKAAPLMRRLRQAVQAYTDKGMLALIGIKKALAKAHIDVSFVDKIENKINRLRNRLTDAVLSPVQHLETTATQQLHRAEQPVRQLETEIEAVLTQMAHAFDPLKEALEAYVAAAARIGIHPR